MVVCPTGVTETVEVYSVQRIMEMFGVKERTVREWISSGELGASKIGKAYFATEEDIADFIKRKRVQPRKSPQNESE